MSTRTRRTTSASSPGDPRRQLEGLKLADQIASARARSGLSQAGLAGKLGTKQAGVARMERATYTGYTVGTLARIAAATGANLEIRLVSASKPRPVVRGALTNKTARSPRNKP